VTGWDVLFRRLWRYGYGALGSLYPQGADGREVELPVGADGTVLTADATATGGVSWQASTGGAGASALPGLTDVDPAATSGASDGDVLTFDSVSGLWGPAAPSVSGGDYAATAPDTVADLYRWFKADAGVTKDGSDKVSDWADQSGLTGGDATQATGTKQFTWIDNVLDGLPVMRAASASATEMAVDLTGLVGVGHTLFIVEGKRTASPGNILGGASSGSNGSPHIGYNNTTQFIAALWGGTTVSAPALAFGVDTFRAWTVVLNTAAGRKIELVREEVASNSDLSTISTIAGGGRIGQARTFYFTGDLAEIIIYNRALSFAERRGVEAYLIDRYPSVLLARLW
jgi:hypothetical protein